MSAFKLIGVANNRTWGPDSKNEDLVNQCMGELKKYQFEPSMKFEKIGKICDFTSSSYQKNVKDANKNSNEGNALEDEMQFQTVDLRAGQKQKGPMYNKKKIMNKQTTQAFAQKQEEENNLYSSRIKTAEQKKQKLLQQAKTARMNARHRIFTEWSIEPTPVWTVECEIMFNELPKKLIKMENFQMQDIYFRGRLLYYDKKFENINVKNPPGLVNHNKDNNYLVCKTMDDESLMEILLEEDKKNRAAAGADGMSSTNIVVVSTDQILSCLMSAAQSKYSWHLLITKEGNKIIIDKDEDSIVDLLTVNENSIDAPTQDNENKINSLQALGFEAIKINQRFRKQVLLKNEQPAEQFDNASFTAQNCKNFDVLYRYRKIVIPPIVHGSSKKNCTLITRGEIHSKLKGTANSYVYICALNEYDIKSHKNWRSQIENQKGALLANEIRNNTSKLQKFICQALISGCEDIKLGFISRKNANDAENHNILSIQSHKTKDLSTQIGLKYENIWGILRYIVDIMSEKPDGKYVILKDPLKALLRVYCTHDDENN
ncbi:hypothetical protein AK88_02580 [Plasmodium fragile]|uniref:Eukaryotic translation initiation factor 3 subunit D n=1 Tax=Plasmodium fragile TaxID=5857 RepID=A0A0D9QLB7_PLAFR|nr:uncharacterized protein AK88_02580 [Plasmodium fragile]KJP87824.1 hypothetical protein AK88_02580 [Plasmodium fragile]